MSDYFSMRIQALHHARKPTREITKHKRCFDCSSSITDSLSRQTEVFRDNGTEAILRMTSQFAIHVVWKLFLEGNIIGWCCFNSEQFYLKNIETVCAKNPTLDGISVFEHLRFGDDSLNNINSCAAGLQRVIFSKDMADVLHAGLHTFCYKTKYPANKRNNCKLFRI